MGGVFVEFIPRLYAVSCIRIDGGDALRVHDESLHKRIRSVSPPPSPPPFPRSPTQRNPHTQQLGRGVALSPGLPPRLTPRPPGHPPHRHIR